MRCISVITWKDHQIAPQVETNEEIHRHTEQLVDHVRSISVRISRAKGKSQGDLSWMEDLARAYCIEHERPRDRTRIECNQQCTLKNETHFSFIASETLG